MLRRVFLKAGLAPLVPFTLLAQTTTTKSTVPPILINAGTGGNNTFDLLTRLDQDCLVHQPELVLLTVGTNDMNSQKHVPLPQFKKNLIELVQGIKRINSQVGLMTLLPVHEPYLMTRHPPAFYQPEGFPVRIAKMNDTIRDVARQHSLLFMDMHHIFTQIGQVGEAPESLIQNEANSQKKDGVHPTPEGYRTMAVAVYQALTNSSASYRRIVCFGDSITRGDGQPEGKNYPAYLKKLLFGK